MLPGALLALASMVFFQEDVARWKFDGDVKDSGPAALPTQAVGRIEFIDSPVSGKMAVFNGVDAYVQIDPPGKLGAGSGDFSLSAWIFPLDRRASPIFSRKGWSLQQLDGGVLKLVLATGEMATRAGSFPANQWNHVVVSLKRVEDKFTTALEVNGDLAMVGFLPTADLDAEQAPLLMGKGSDEGKLFTGFLDDVRLFSRALAPGEGGKLTDEGMPWLRPKAHAKTPFAGKFEVVQDDVIVFAGGENGRVGQELGYLDTLLPLGASGKRVRYRGMAWEGDTVYEQPRPLNFGSWSDQFRRTGATIVFAQFGQVEALEGKAGLARFEAAYEALIAQFSQVTKRIVLVSPVPFGRGTARQPDLSARNEDLKLYVGAIRKLAAKNGCLFIDLATKPLAGEGVTRDGLHLSTEGHWLAAKETVRQLELPGVSDLDTPDPKGVFPRESYEKLRGAIRVKNGLWSEWWRPTNWAFLNGDRIEQPSSRDHLDRRVRWFPVEVQQLPAMLRREEDKIETLIQAERK
ncbi:MAG: hypothetical protein HY293_09355 [Planctomycetes bacterium]|nr:hypothetical protein [Planctomycetota bacterium]